MSPVPTAPNTAEPIINSSDSDLPTTTKLAIIISIVVIIVLAILWWVLVCLKQRKQSSLREIRISDARHQSQYARLNSYIGETSPQLSPYPMKQTRPSRNTKELRLGDSFKEIGPYDLPPPVRSPRERPVTPDPPVSPWEFRGRHYGGI